MPYIKCKNCSKDTYKRPSSISKQTKYGSFCSNHCFNEYKKSLTPEGNRVCIVCGKNFRTNVAYLKRRHNKNNCQFCSRKCWNEYARRDLSTWVGSQGYLECADGRVHRLLMERRLGRKLMENEEVHHKNGNKLDNRLSNLTLMDRGEHRSLHSRERWEKYRNNG